MNDPVAVDMLARFFVLENLVATLVAHQPDAAAIIADFEAFTAQQIAMQAANGTKLDLNASMREHLAQLAHFVSSKAAG